MIKNIEDEAFEYLKSFRRISPVFLMRKFKLTYKMAINVCQKIYLRQHVEARKLSRELQGSL